MKTILAAAFGGLVISGAMPVRAGNGGAVSPYSAIPASVQAEHLEIQQALRRATRAPGKVGVAARALSAVLEPHFIREEQIALPPLSALQPLAEGKPVAGLLGLVALSDSLKQELPQMLNEHRLIAQAADRLEAAATEENRPANRQLAEHLKMHALSEEEIMYPAAVLAGELINSRARREHVAVPCTVADAP